MKRISRYINGTCDYGILCSDDTNSTLAMPYDVDWARSAGDRKNTFGACFFLGNNLISLFNKKQSCVSLSNAEVEYIDAERSCTQFLWMKQMSKEYNMDIR